MFAILRLKKIKGYAAVAKAYDHNLRLPGHWAGNIDEARSSKNVVLEASIASSQALKDYYEGVGVKERANNVHLLEFVATTSPEWWLKATEAQKNKWVKTQVEFFKKEFGDKVKHAVLHLDEKTPHIHVFVSSEETKTHKYKNQKGEFFKEVTTLNSRKYDRGYLIDLQTRYANANKPLGLVRGLKGSKNKHKLLKDFNKEIDNALSKNYSNSVENFFDSKIKKNFFGMLNPNDAKSLFVHETNKLLKQIKLLKTKLDLDSASKKNNEIYQKKIKELSKKIDEVKTLEAFLNQEFDKVDEYKNKIEKLEEENNKKDSYIKKLEEELKNKPSLKIKK